MVFFVNCIENKVTDVTADEYCGKKTSSDKGKANGAVEHSTIHEITHHDKQVRFMTYVMILCMF